MNKCTSDTAEFQSSIGFTDRQARLAEQRSRLRESSFENTSPKAMLRWKSGKPRRVYENQGSRRELGLRFTPAEANEPFTDRVEVELVLVSVGWDRPRRKSVQFRMCETVREGVSSQRQHPLENSNPRRRSGRDFAQRSARGRRGKRNANSPCIRPGLPTVGVTFSGSIEHRVS